MSDGIGNWVDDFYQLNPDAVRHEPPTKTKKVNTLPLESELDAMDFRNMDFYANLSDEHKKEISMWILMRYMSSSTHESEHHLMMVNDLVNADYGSLMKHPELQWKLLAMCGTGKRQPHKWIPPGRKGKKNKLEEQLSKMFPLMKDDELALLQRINSSDDFERYFKSSALDDKLIKDLLKSHSEG